jgi:hypothetical protein
MKEKIKKEIEETKVYCDICGKEIQKEYCRSTVCDSCGRDICRDCGIWIPDKYGGDSSTVRCKYCQEIRKTYLERYMEIKTKIADLEDEIYNICHDYRNECIFERTRKENDTNKLYKKDKKCRKLKSMQM